MRFWSASSGLFFNLREADTSDEMEEVAERVQPALTALSNDIGLDAGLFARVKAVWEGPREGLSETDIRLLEQTYKGFVRSGAALSEEDKALYRQYTEELSAATLRFGPQHTLDATNAFAVNITDAEQVAELPEFVREMMAADAAARGEKGWTVTLKTPSYLPFMTYSSQRGIKERLYRAYNSRALGGEWDNGPLIERIVTLRGRIARLLGLRHLCRLCSGGAYGGVDGGGAVVSGGAAHGDGSHGRIATWRRSRPMRASRG